MNRLCTLFIQKILSILEGTTDDEQVEVYVYGLLSFIYTTLPFVILFCISFLFDITLKISLWYYLFITLRKFSGGYHATNPILCLLYTVSIGLSYIVFEKTYCSIAYPIYLSLILLSLFVFLCIVPITKKEFTKKAKLLCKIKLCIIVVFFLLLFTYLPIFQVCFLHAVYSTFILCIAGKIHK